MLWMEVKKLTPNEMNSTVSLFNSALKRLLPDYEIEVITALNSKNIIVRRFRQTTLDEFTDLDSEATIEPRHFFHIAIHPLLMQSHKVDETLERVMSLIKKYK